MGGDEIIKKETGVETKNFPIIMISWGYRS